MSFSSCAIAFCLVLAAPLWAEAQTAQEIVDRLTTENRLGFDTGVSKVRLITRDRSGYVKNQLIETSSDEKEGLRRAHLRFLEPADVRGTEFLTLAQKAADDLQYIHLPALRRTRRIAGSAKNSRFMGTDFTYADLEFRDLRSGKLKRLKDATAGGRKAFVVQSDADSDDAPYSRVKIWVDQKLYIALKMEFYDQGGERLKVLDVLKLKKRSTGRIYASELRMKNLQSGSQTDMKIEDLRQATDLPQRLFDANQLGN
jgi:hypothetical protein